MNQETDSRADRWLGITENEHLDRPFDLLYHHTSAISPQAFAARVQSQRLSTSSMQSTWGPIIVVYSATPDATTVITSESPAVIAVDELQDPAITLKSVYEFSGLTWDQIADVLRVSRQSVNNWRRGEAVTETNRRRIAALNRLLRSITPGLGPGFRMQYLLAEDPNHSGQSRLAVLAATLDEVAPVSSGRLNAADLLIENELPEPVAPSGRSRRFNRSRSGRGARND